jgi:hypothetical protein
MSTAWVIRITTIIIWGILIGAAFGVGRCYDLITTGWEGIGAIYAIMISGKTIEVVQSLKTKKEE